MAADKGAQEDSEEQDAKSTTKAEAEEEENPAAQEEKGDAGEAKREDGEKGSTDGEGVEAEEKTEGESKEKTDIEEAEEKTDIEKAEEKTDIEEAEEKTGIEEAKEKTDIEGAESSKQTEMFAEGFAEAVDIVPNLLSEGRPGSPGPLASVSDKDKAESQHVHIAEPEEVESDVPVYNRAALIKQYRDAMAQREILLRKNSELQNKIAWRFLKKRTEDRQEQSFNVTEREQAYLRTMAQLDELMRQEMEVNEKQELVKEELRARCKEKCQQADAERNNYLEFKKAVALNSFSSRSGKPVSPKDLEQIMSMDNKKEAELNTVRLEYFKLKNKMKKAEKKLKAKEELGKGLHLIDFEQLKIENQAYNEKIEERNEELLKLRRKISTTVQVMTHLKEKLQYMGAENVIHNHSLQSLEVHVSQKRDVLTRTKQARDALRSDIIRLRRKCGLLGNDTLLRDFEERKDEHDLLRCKLGKLQMRHAELTLMSGQLLKKIVQVRKARAAATIARENRKA